MKRSTRVRCAAETSGPTTTPGSRGSPMRSVGPDAARRRVNGSYSGSSISTRVPAMQI